MVSVPPLRSSGNTLVVDKSATNYDSEWPALPTRINPIKIVNEQNPSQICLNHVRYTPKIKFIGTEFFPPFFKTPARTQNKEYDPVEENSDDYLDRFDEMALQMKIKGKDRQHASSPPRYTSRSCNDTKAHHACIPQRTIIYCKSHDISIPSCKLSSEYKKIKQAMQNGNNVLRQTPSERKQPPLQAYHYMPLLSTSPIENPSRPSLRRSIYTVDLSHEVYYASEIKIVRNSKIVEIWGKVEEARQQGIEIQPIIDYYPPQYILDDIGEFDEYDDTDCYLDRFEKMELQMEAEDKIPAVSPTPSRKKAKNNSRICQQNIRISKVVKELKLKAQEVPNTALKNINESLCKKTQRNFDNALKLDRSIKQSI